MNLFKKIIDKELPADIVYEDDLCLAFKDIAPQAPTHVLIIPKKEIVSMAHVTTEDKEVLGHILVTASKIAKELGLNEKGYRLITNIGNDGGQTVFHLHFHILGGKSLNPKLA